MAVFNNINDWASSMKSNMAGIKSGSNGDSPIFITDDILKEEARILRQCIQDRIDNYYSSYSPEAYIRQNRLRNSLKCDVSITGTGDNRHMYVYFDSVLDMGSSVISDKWNIYSRSRLMNSGWKVRDDVWFRHIRRFGSFKGAHFIENGIKDYKSKSKYAKYIEVTIGYSEIQLL